METPVEQGKGDTVDRKAAQESVVLPEKRAWQEPCVRLEPRARGEPREWSVIPGCVVWLVWRVDLARRETAATTAAYVRSADRASRVMREISVCQVSVRFLYQF